MKRAIQNLTEETYVYSWGADGFSLLFQSMVCRASAKHSFVDSFSVCMNGDLKVFWSKDARINALKHGSELFCSKESAEKNCKKIDQLASRLKAYAQIQKFSRKTLTDFVNDTENFLHFYLMLDPEFTDDVLANTKDEELLDYLGEQKNVFREKLNNLFFTKESVFSLFLKRASDLLKINVNLIESLGVEQLAEFSEGDYVEQKNKDNFLIILQGGNVEYVFDESTIGNIWAEFEIKNSKNAKTLQGVSVARKGKHKGVVKKLDINYVKDFGEEVEKLNKKAGGYVFVADHTSPELIPIMKKSVAIVTNMGGLLSHAAITSREMDLVCIVGTGNATQVLKDGDLVEVDTDKGVVRIVKRV